MSDAQRVLVVDDDRGMRETLSAILEEEGYQVFKCRDGTTALELLEETSIDVVVSDLKLPDTSGLEILSALKKRSSDTAFILMTGYASVETAIQSVNRGAFAYHVKSLDMRALFGSVRNALAQRRLLVENRKLLVELQRSNEELGEKNRELEETSVAKNQILSTVSHELKTPLTSVMGYIERLLQQEAVGPLNDRQQRYLETAKRNSHRLKLLIDDLLDISRIEAGTMELEIGELDVKEAVAEVLDSMKVRLEGKGSRVEVSIPAGLGKVKADRLRFCQILGNLLSNACKYSGAEATVKVRAKRKRGVVQVEVSDTGIGISKGDQTMLFKKFFRVNNSWTREESGTGLGLFITRHLVEAHGGRMWVSSEEGEGSTFGFILPAADSPGQSNGMV